MTTEATLFLLGETCRKVLHGDVEQPPVVGPRV